MTHHFNEVMTLRPEIGLYHAYNTPAFDNGKRSSQLIVACDLIVRF